MGKNNTIVKRWLSDKKRSADLFNAEVFSGKQIVQPEDLEMIPGESNIIIKDKNGKEKLVTRYRDIMMRWKYGVDFLILAIENQDKIHYAMPVRNMVYDGLAYTEQIEQLWKQHVDNDDEVTDAEYLSKFKKEDKLNPVITLVFYYGDEPWDGETDIYGMLGFDEKFIGISEMKKFIPNYHINLVDISKVSNISNYISDLRYVLSMIQYKKDKEGLSRYVNEHKTYFEKIDEDSYQMINILLKSKK